VVGNFIGLDSHRRDGDSNAFSGVSVQAADATIGGTAPGARNMISATPGPVSRLASIR
jgi:hypothetical protein